MVFLILCSAKTVLRLSENLKIDPAGKRRGHCFYRIGMLVYGRGTRLLNPMKAMARIPAVTSAMGTPFIPLGVPVSSSCSRMPAKITNAKVNPTAMEAE